MAKITIGSSSVDVSDEVVAMAEEAAKTYSWSDDPGRKYANAAEWALDWLRNSLVTYHQQKHTADAQKAFNKSKRQVEALFET